MHSYSIDSEERMRLPFFIAVASILLAIAIQGLLLTANITVPWWSEAPSALGLYGLFYYIFDNFLWKWQPLRLLNIVKTPNLNGNWKGELTSSFDNFTEKCEVLLKIHQSWTRINITLTTYSSISQSVVGAISSYDMEENTLSYQYSNKPIPKATSTMHPHEGTAVLNFQKESCHGTYYSNRDRQNYGDQ